MPKSWKISIKMLVIMALFVGFSFVIIEQRLESKAYEARIKGLQTSIADINLQKREVMIRIESEMQRLSSYDYDSISKPITMNDIIVVPLADHFIPETENAKTTSSLDRLLAMLLSAAKDKSAAELPK